LSKNKNSKVNVGLSVVALGMYVYEVLPLLLNEKQRLLDMLENKCCEGVFYFSDEMAGN
jgi:hypothetical protein